MHTLKIAAAAATIALAACASSGATTTRPKLELLERVPLTVAGQGFAASERLTLTADVNGERMTLAVRASPGGALHVLFRGLAAGRCQTYFVVARSAHRIRATVASRTIECAQT